MHAPGVWLDMAGRGWDVAGSYHFQKVSAFFVFSWLGNDGLIQVITQPNYAHHTKRPEGSRTGVSQWKETCMIPSPVFTATGRTTMPGIEETIQEAIRSGGV